MDNTDKSIIYTEVWNAKPSWLALTKEERRRFLEEKINPLLGSLIEAGAEVLGCAINDNTTPEKMDYRYMVVWKFPNREFCEKIEKGAFEAGFLEYFDQGNSSGTIISPPALNENMVNLDE